MGLPKRRSDKCFDLLGLKGLCQRPDQGAGGGASFRGKSRR